MAQIVYNTTTGQIEGVFIDSVTLPTLPSGFASFTAAGDVNDLVDKHVDISGPSIEELDYLRFTGPDDQDVSCVETHGVQKVEGDTDVDLVGSGDDEGILIQTGDELATPGSSKGFLEERSGSLLNGAATFKLAASAISGEIFLYVKADGLKLAKKKLNFV